MGCLVFDCLFFGYVFGGGEIVFCLLFCLIGVVVGVGVCCCCFIGFAGGGGGFEEIFFVVAAVLFHVIVCFVFLFNLPPGILFSHIGDQFCVLELYCLYFVNFQGSYTSAIAISVQF